MELTRLREDLTTLLDHMREAKLSENYVGSTLRAASLLTEVAPKLRSWADAFAMCEAGEEGFRPYLRPHVAIAMRFEEDGTLPRTDPDSTRRNIEPSARDRLGEGMAAVIEAYEASPEAARKRLTTVSTEVSAASRFLEALEAEGVASPADADEDAVLRVLTDADGMPIWSPCVVRHARGVIKAAHGVEGAERLASLMPVPTAWSKAPDALSATECEAVLAALSDAEALSQRDRAIGRVLFHTGMRRGDVAALTLDSIDWERDQITIVQRKTGALLTLPLLPQVGNAIWDYVRGDRGDSDDPHVFLSEHWPRGALSPQGIHHVACAVLDAAGVRTGKGERRGCHIFRRTLASTMVAAGVDRSVIASTLGHENVRTTELYVAADIEGLRRRALDVSLFPLEEGTLDDQA